MQYKHAVINTNSKAGNAQPGGSRGGPGLPQYFGKISSHYTWAPSMIIVLRMPCHHLVL